MSDDSRPPKRTWPDEMSIFASAVCFSFGSIAGMVGLTLLAVCANSDKLAWRVPLVFLAVSAVIWLMNIPVSRWYRREGDNHWKRTSEWIHRPLKR